MTKCSLDTLTVDNLRHAEYYNMQKVFDELYAKAKNRQSFDNLMDIILSKENILLAYRNIKTNTGSNTQGTDTLTIKDIGSLTAEEVVDKVRSIINSKQGYRPRPVRRKNIPKPNGSLRPLGIPCIWDRLIQQCIKQVIEPICEAQFSEHSYGFRPGRSVENAMAETYRLMNLSKCYFVVEFDIKGFFDNVNHSKLLKQLWALGIHDKHLLFTIKRILKAPVKMPDGSLYHPQNGTPQGGIISPLLANIVLNELDWWVASQWELNPVTDKYSQYKERSGAINKTSGYRAMRNTNLKEMHIVRYADDFRIFCRTRSDANRTKTAISRWLGKRLKLEASPEKTRVVNTKRKSSEFLGFEIRMRDKRKTKVIESHMCSKKKCEITKNLKKQIKGMQRAKDRREALKYTLRYNATVLGVQNYFRIASHINIDCSEIAKDVNRTLYNRLGNRRNRLVRTGRDLTKAEKEKYGASKMLRYDSTTGTPIYPIAYIRTKHPVYTPRGMTPYSQTGRKAMHKNLGINTRLMHKLMLSTANGTVEYADNRISLYSAQLGKCAITGKQFTTVSEIHCHHKLPKTLGGTDEYCNLILVNELVHKLIHATKVETIAKYINALNLTKAQLKKINNLRAMANVAQIT